MSLVPDAPTIPESYFLSAIETLLEAFDDINHEYITFHDSCEAYDTLCNRIRLQVKLLQYSSDLPCLEPFRMNARRIWSSLRRDIRRAHENPIGHDFSQFSVSGPTQLTEEHLQLVNTSALLCQHAIRFASAFCTIPSLYSIISVPDMLGLLGDILSIVSTRTLPTPNSSKTHTLVIWFLRVQRLPRESLEPQIPYIVNALDRALVGDFGDQAVLDALYAVHTFLSAYPDVFSTPLKRIFEKALNQFSSTMPSVRCQVGIAMCAFALARIDGWLSIDELQDDILEVFTASADDINILTTVLITSSRAISELRPEALHAIAVLPPLLVLMGPEIFSQVKLLKPCMDLLALMTVAKNPYLNQLHGLIWKCLIWCYLVLVEKGAEKALDRQSKMSREKRVFLVVKQETHGGIGRGFVAALLGQRAQDRRKDGVQKALTIVTDMVTSTSFLMCEEGFRLLVEMTLRQKDEDLGEGEADHISQHKHYHLLPRGLFDGSLFRANAHDLGDITKSIISNAPQPPIARLSEAEMTQHWDTIVGIWLNYLKSGRSVESLDDVIALWQRLLELHCPLTQEAPSSTLSVVGKRVALVLCQFLQLTERFDEQAHQLRIVGDLWSTMEKVFNSSWLSGPAQLVMAAILKNSYTVSNNKVKLAWISICSKLVLVGIPTLPHILYLKSRRREERDTQIQLWMLLAKVYQSYDESVAWQDLISFLVIPLGAWTMSEEGYELWDGTLRVCFSLAGSAGLRPLEVVEILLKQVGASRIEIFALSPRYLLISLMHIDLSVARQLPTEICSTVGGVLTMAYPPDDEIITIFSEIFIYLKDLISSMTPSLVIPFLSIARVGFCKWLSDAQEIFMPTELSAVTECIYCSSLELLLRQRPTLDNLLVISDFLCSVFGRIIEPATGPVAFARFWRATYLNYPQWIPNYSPELKSCLKAVSYAWSSDFAVGISTNTESGDISKMIAPDSQASAGNKDGNGGGEVQMTFLSSTSPAAFSDEELTSVQNLPPEGEDEAYTEPGIEYQAASQLRHAPDTSPAPLRQLSRRSSLQSNGLSTPRHTSSPVNEATVGKPIPRKSSLKRQRTELLVPGLSKERGVPRSYSSTRSVSFLLPDTSEDNPYDYDGDETSSLRKAAAPKPTISSPDPFQESIAPIGWRIRTTPGKIDTNLWSPPIRSALKRKAVGLPESSSLLFESSDSESLPAISSSPSPVAGAEIGAGGAGLSEDEGQYEDIESWQARELKTDRDAGSQQEWLEDPIEDSDILDELPMPSSEFEVAELATQTGFSSEDIDDDLSEEKDLQSTGRKRKIDTIFDEEGPETSLVRPQWGKRPKATPIPFHIYPPSFPTLLEPSSPMRSSDSWGQVQEVLKAQRKQSRAKHPRSPPVHRVAGPSKGRVYRQPHDGLNEPVQITAKGKGSPTANPPAVQPPSAPPPKFKMGIQGLQQAYAAVTDQRASQISVQDLMQVTTWVSKLGQALTEQMSKKMMPQQQEEDRIGVGEAEVRDGEAKSELAHGEQAEYNAGKGEYAGEEARRPAVAIRRVGKGGDRKTSSKDKGKAKETER